MLHYQPRVRPSASVLRERVAEWALYRNAAWLLQSLAGSAEAKQAVGALSVEPSLIRSDLYRRLLRHLRRFFADTFEPKSGLHSNGHPEFFFSSLHAAHHEAALRAHPHLWFLYQMLTQLPEAPERVLAMGAHEYGFPLPDHLPSERIHYDYVTTRLRDALIERSLKEGMLALFAIYNMVWDNPFLCVNDDFTIDAPHNCRLEWWIKIWEAQAGLKGSYGEQKVVSHSCWIRSFDLESRH